MPYESQAQRAFMHIHHPGIAKRWDKHTPKDAKLPPHVDHADSPSSSSATEKAADASSSIARFLARIGKPVAGAAERIGVPHLSQFASTHRKGNAMLGAGTLGAAGALGIGGAAAAGAFGPTDLSELQAQEKAGAAAPSTPGMKALGSGLKALGGGIKAMGGNKSPRSNGSLKGNASLKHAESIGTPFMDGFFQACFDYKLSGEQVASLIEKGAELEGPPGEEIRSFMERMVA